MSGTALGSAGGSAGLGDPGRLTQAHGFGGQADLPIPLDLAVTGAVAALVVSFTVLAVAWRRPRYETGERGRAAPQWLDDVVSARWFAIALRVVGMVLFGYALVTAMFGRDSLINPFLGIFYVWLWVGLVPMSLLFGSFWRAISPVRTLHALLARATRTDPDHGLFTYPERLGHWPAAFGLLAFVWLELVYPFPTSLGSVRLWCAVYLAAMLVGGLLFGSRFFRYADPFEVYSTLVGHLSVWRRREGRLWISSPLANLATVPPTAGLIGVVGVLFGSTAFDSFGESPGFVGFVQDSAINGQLIRNVALLVFCGGAMLVLVVGTMLTGVDGRTPRRSLPDRLAHSIVPIIVGYVGAHYLTALLETGSRTLIYASDPFSLGWNVLGTGGWGYVTWFSYHPELLANLKVLMVVLGHVAGAVAAHDRAISILPRRHQLTGQLPLLMAMVVFTAGGLYLLFAA